MRAFIVVSLCRQSLSPRCILEHATSQEAGTCRIGQPFSGPQELHQLFSKYDTNHSGQLEFNEFLELFKDKLQDLQKVLEFISMKPAKSKSTEASVLEVYLFTIAAMHFAALWNHVLPWQHVKICCKLLWWLH